MKGESVLVQIVEEIDSSLIFLHWQSKYLNSTVKSPFWNALWEHQEKISDFLTAFGR